MEARTIGWSIAALVIGTFGIVAMSAVEKETASRDLARANDALHEAKNDLESSRKARSLMEERVAQAKKLKEAKTGATEELSGIEAAITAAGQKEEALKKAWQAERDEYEATVTAVRRKVIGSKLAKLDAGGMILDGVTIKGVADGLVALEHSAGLTKLPASKLPAELAAKLMPDWNPKLTIKTPAFAPATTVATEDPPEDVPESGTPLPNLPGPAPVAGPGNPHTSARIKLEQDRTNLALKMDAARGEQRLQSNKYAQLNSQYLNSRMRSKTVTIPPGMEDARKAAEAIGRQLETARQQHNRMTVDLEQLMQKEAAWTPPAQ